MSEKARELLKKSSDAHSPAPKVARGGEAAGSEDVPPQPTTLACAQPSAPQSTVQMVKTLRHYGLK